MTPLVIHLNVDIRVVYLSSIDADRNELRIVVQFVVPGQLSVWIDAPNTYVCKQNILADYYNF